MGPQLKMSFKVGDHQSIEVTHQNGEDGIIIYNDLYHKEALLEIQFYDDIKYYTGTGTYRRVHLTYTVGKKPEAFNATIKTIIDPTAGIDIDCSERTYKECLDIIELIVDSLKPNKRFTFEYTNEYISNKHDDEVVKEHVSEDNVNHPSHYKTGEFECFDVMKEALGDDSVKDFCIVNAFKYIYRHKRKNGVEDIKKAKWYIDKYLELEENNND